jgi:hypothetical protein
MQTTLIDPADLFRLVHFFDILAPSSSPYLERSSLRARGWT